MPGVAAADIVVGGVDGLPAGVAGLDREHALEVVEDSLDAPEAARAQGCDRLRLEVRADNGAGIRLYQRRGYTRFAVRPDYYEDGMEAWRYERAL